MAGKTQTMQSTTRALRRTSSSRARSPLRGLLHSAVAAFVRARGHLVLTALMVCWSVPPWFGGSFSLSAVLPVALVGFGIYQLNRLYDTVEDGINAPGECAATESQQRAVRMLGWLSLAASIVAAWLVAGPVGVGFVGFAIAGGVLYSRPIDDADGAGRRLKNVPAVKNVIPAVIWSAATVIFPGYVTGVADRSAQYVMALLIAAGVFAIEVAWDIRDEVGDRAAGVRTLPVLFGGDRAAAVAAGVTTIVGIVPIAMVLAGGLPVQWLVPAGGLLSIGAGTSVVRHRLAVDRSWSHVFVVFVAVMLLALGIVGRWAFGTRT